MLKRFIIGAGSLENISLHLDRALSFKERHIQALHDAETAVIEHNARAQKASETLLAAAAEVHGRIGQANDQLAFIKEQLGKS